MSYDCIICALCGLFLGWWFGAGQRFRFMQERVEFYKERERALFAWYGQQCEDHEEELLQLHAELGMKEGNDEPI